MKTNDPTSDEVFVAKAAEHVRRKDEVQRRFRGGRKEKEMTESNTRRSKTTAPGERHSRGGLLTAIPTTTAF